MHLIVGKLANQNYSHSISECVKALQFSCPVYEEYAMSSYNRRTVKLFMLLLTTTIDNSKWMIRIDIR